MGKYKDEFVVKVEWGFLPKLKINQTPEKHT